MPTKQTKKIFSITQKLDETYWFDWVNEEIASFSNLKRTCNNNQRKTRKNEYQLKKCTQYIDKKTVKRIGINYLKQEEAVYKDMVVY